MPSTMTCPTCNGTKSLYVVAGHPVECPTCQGKGIIPVNTPGAPAPGPSPAINPIPFPAPAPGDPWWGKYIPAIITAIIVGLPTIFGSIYSYKAHTQAADASIQAKDAKVQSAENATDIKAGLTEINKVQQNVNQTQKKLGIAAPAAEAKKD